MSICYYITRNDRPFVRDGHHAITQAQWEAAVAADPDLALAQPEDAGPRGASAGKWAVWRSYPGGYPAWFVLLRNGDVEVKGMDDHLKDKCRRLASELGARMFCETGDELK